MKRSRLNRISPKKVQELIEQGKSIPASSFQVAKKLGKKKRPRMQSKKTWYKGVQHGSKTQLLVYQNFELMQKAGELTELEAEKDFVLNAEGGGQVGTHRVDIFYLCNRKGYYQLFNVKGDYEGSIDELSKWKRRHLLKQYPTIKGIPVKYDFYIADEYGTRVYRTEAELLEDI